MDGSRTPSPVFHRNQRDNAEPPPQQQQAGADNVQGEDAPGAQAGQPGAGPAPQQGQNAGDQRHQDDGGVGDPLRNVPVRGYRLTILQDLENVAARLTPDSSLDDCLLVHNAANDAVLDCIVELLLNFRHAEVDDQRSRSLRAATSSRILATKLMVFARVTEFPPRVEQKKLFLSNFQEFLQGYMRYVSLIAALSDHAARFLAAWRGQLNQDNVQRVFREAMQLANFVRKCVSSACVLAARQHDAITLGKMNLDWAAIRMTLESLEIPVGVRLKILKVKSGRGRESDHQAIKAFIDGQYQRIAHLEEQVTDQFEKLFNFVSSIAAHFMGLSNQGERLISPIMRKLDDIFGFGVVGGYEPPELNHQLESLLLEVPGFKLDPVQLGVTHNQLDAELDKILQFAEELNKCCGTTDSGPPGGPIPAAPDPEVASGLGVGGNPEQNLDLGTKLEVAAASRAFDGLRNEMEEVEHLLQMGPGEDIQALHKPLDRLQTHLTWSNSALSGLKTSSTDVKLNSESRSHLVRHIDSYNELVLRADSLLGTYKRHKEVVRSQTDSRSRLMSRTLPGVTVGKWPKSDKESAKRHPDQVDCTLLDFLSEILVWSADPLIDEKSKQKKLINSITDSTVRLGVERCVTFHLSISWLLNQFSPDRGSLNRLSKSLSRLGHPYGAKDYQSELSYLMKVSSLKFQLLRGHYTLQLLSKCKDPTPQSLAEIGRSMRSDQFLGNLILDTSQFIKPQTLLGSTEIDDDPVAAKLREQHEILLSYNWSKELLYSVVKRCLTTRSQLDYQSLAQGLNVNLEIDSQFLNYFWYFVSLQLRNLGATSAGLKTKIEVGHGAAAGKKGTSYANYHLEASDDNEDAPIVNYIGGATGKQKKTKKKPKKDTTHRQNLATETAETVPCPLNGHSGHRAYNCQELLSSGIKNILKLGLCPSCLAAKLSSSHSNLCKPSILRQRNGKRETVSLFCRRCPKVSLPAMNVSAYQNNRICGCTRKKSNINFLPSPSGKRSPGGSRSQSRASNGSTSKQSKARTTKSKIVNKGLNVVTEQDSDSDEDESDDVVEEFVNVTLDATPTTDKESSGSDEEEVEEVLCNYSQILSDQFSEAEDSEGGYESAELGVENIFLLQVYDEVLEPEPETFIVNHIGNPIGGSLLGDEDDENGLTLLGVLHRLEYINQPHQASYLLSESIFLLSVSGELRSFTAIFDSGSQRCVLNTAAVSRKFSHRFPSQFKIATVQSNGKEKSDKQTYKCDIVVTTNPTPTLSDLCKLNCLCLNFQQGLNNCQVELDPSTRRLIATTQVMVGSEEPKSALSVIIGCDGQRVFPVELLRRHNFSLYKSRFDGRRVLGAGVFPEDLQQEIEDDLQTVGIHLITWESVDANTPGVIPTTQGYLSQPLSTELARSLWTVDEMDVADDDDDEEKRTNVLFEHDWFGCDDDEDAQVSSGDDLVVDATTDNCDCEIGASSACECGNHRADDAVINLGIPDAAVGRPEDTNGIIVIPYSEPSYSDISSMGEWSSFESCDTNYSNCVSSDTKTQLAKTLPDMRDKEASLGLTPTCFLCKSCSLNFMSCSCPMDMELLEKQEQASRTCYENFRLLRRYYETHQLDHVRSGEGDSDREDEEPAALQPYSTGPAVQPEPAVVDSLHEELSDIATGDEGNEQSPRHRVKTDGAPGCEPSALDRMIQLERQLLGIPDYYPSPPHHGVEDMVEDEAWSSGRNDYYTALSRSLNLDPPASVPASDQNMCDECHMKMSGCCWEKRMNTPD